MIIFFYYCFLLVVLSNSTFINVDINVEKLREFTGIGAISGGGPQENFTINGQIRRTSIFVDFSADRKGTSKLLISYPEKQRDEILDYLFKPGYGAALQILKVEIGGDAQSTAGSEASHRHSEEDLNFHRGYEWWLMKEAVKRNPAIHLSALPWAWPAWVSGGAIWWPYENVTRTADYVTSWILGARRVHNLTINSVGIWNEKPYDVPYIKALKRDLLKHDLDHVKIIAADLTAYNEWDIAKSMLSDAHLMQDVDIIGVHYPDGSTNQNALLTGKNIWSSEDFSSYADDVGAGCIARAVNQNYVHGKMSSTIAWNLIASHYAGTVYDSKALMLARQPWSGYYEVAPPIWAIAHTTQFTSPGWRYLDVEGVLPSGGTVVALVHPRLDHLTFVFETMDTTTNAFCILPPHKPSAVHPQNITFQLPNAFKALSHLNVWITKLKLRNASESVHFVKLSPISVHGGKFSVELCVNCVVTVTTMPGGLHAVTAPPREQPFPSRYRTDFNDLPEFSEPPYFAQQVGVFEIVRRAPPGSRGSRAGGGAGSGVGGYDAMMRQTIVDAPLHWCPFSMVQTIAIVGDFHWSDVNVTVDVHIPLGGKRSATAVFLAVRVNDTGCTTFMAKGVYFFADFHRREWRLSLDLAETIPYASGKYTFNGGEWYTMTLYLKGRNIALAVNGDVIYSRDDFATLNSHGFVGIGTANYGLADFDNFKCDNIN